MKLLDKNLGARLRAIISIATAAVAALTLLSQQLDALPANADTATVALLVASATITFLGRFTSVGDADKAA